MPTLIVDVSHVPSGQRFIASADDGHKLAMAVEQSVEAAPISLEDKQDLAGGLMLAMTLMIAKLDRGERGIVEGCSGHWRLYAALRK